MRVSESTCERLHVYVPTTANFIECEKRITERIGGFTRWLAYGHWQGQEEWVQVFEIIGGKHSMGAMAYELAEQYLKDNPNEVEFMSVVTDRRGQTRYSFSTTERTPMNGNFEHDKSSYPYSSLRQGEGAYLVHMPSLKKLAELNLPTSVIYQAALELNIAYWGTPKKDIGPLLKNIKALLLRAAREAYTNRDISGPAYDQVKLSIEGLAD